MRLTLLQLNIFAGSYWDTFVEFIKHHDFDILQLQEIVGEETKVGNINSIENTYKKLSVFLGNAYSGRLYKTETFSSPTSYDGVATFVKNDIKILEEKDIVLKEAVFPFESERTDHENIGRGALALKVKRENNTFWLLNTHLAWSPTPDDSEEKLKQAAHLATFLQKLKEPFIFTGDLNVNPKTKTIHMFDQLGKNLTSLHKVTNTLNPRLHKASHLFPPGLAVDYIFVSNTIEVIDFGVVEEDISDHLGLTAVVSI